MVLYGDIPAIHTLGAGSAKATLVARNDIAGVIIHDKDGQTQCVFTSGAGPRLALLDADGTPLFDAPPVDDGDSGQGDGLDWKGVLGV
jgi:hypothetical protein